MNDLANRARGALACLRSSTVMLVAVDDGRVERLRTTDREPTGERVKVETAVAAAIARSDSREFLDAVDDVDPAAREVAEQVAGEIMAESREDVNEVVTDGSGCFYCGLDVEDAHPRCDAPGCDTKVHGHGPEGKRTFAYCPACRAGEDVDPVDPEPVTDGGQDVDDVEELRERVADLERRVEGLVEASHARGPAGPGGDSR